MSEQKKQFETVDKPDGWVEKSESVGDTVYRYSASWIRKLESEIHWSLYWKQQDILEDYLDENDKILEIGVGTGFTANYLRSRGYETVTFDIDREKKPDVVGNVVHDEIEGNFDHILAFEVFEHIPYEEFLKVLRKLKPILKKSLCMSVPVAEREFLSFQVKLPKLKMRRFALNRSLKKIWKYHFWEIGFEGTSKAKLLADMESAGFKVLTYQVHHKRAFISAMPNLEVESDCLSPSNGECG